MLSDLKSKQRDSYEQERQAKGHLGLFSVHAVSEIRAMFSRQFAGGKRFAQRSTLWDAVFMGIGSMGRDEALASYVLRIVIRLLMNFTLGSIKLNRVFAFAMVRYQHIQCAILPHLDSVHYWSTFGLLLLCHLAARSLCGHDRYRVRHRKGGIR